MSAISHYGATTAHSQVSSLDVIFVAVLYYFGHWPQKVESFKRSLKCTFSFFSFSMKLCKNALTTFFIGAEKGKIRFKNLLSD